MGTVIAKGGGVDVLVDSDADDGRVVATGVGGAGCLFDASPPSNSDILVRAYDGRTKRLEWENELDVSGFDDTASAMVATKGTVFVALKTPQRVCQGTATGEPAFTSLQSWATRLLLMPALTVARRHLRRAAALLLRRRNQA